MKYTLTHIVLFFQMTIKGPIVLTKNFFLTLLCFAGCTYIPEEKVVKDTQVAREKLILNQNEGKWYYKDQAFLGYSVTYHSNGQLAERVGYYKGKKEGLAQKWFENGILRKQSYYKSNRLDGIAKTWWPNGVLSGESHYINGVRHGVQKKWHPNGQLSRQSTLNYGKVDGMQQAWRKNGKLYANYEAKNRRVFGLKRSNLCYALENEIVQH